MNEWLTFKIAEQYDGMFNLPVAVSWMLYQTSHGEWWMYGGRTIHDNQAWNHRSKLPRNWIVA